MFYTNLYIYLCLKSTLPHKRMSGFKYEGSLYVQSCVTPTRGQEEGLAISVGQSPEPLRAVRTRAGAPEGKDRGRVREERGSERCSFSRLFCPWAVWGAWGWGQWLGGQGNEVYVLGWPTLVGIITQLQSHVSLLVPLSLCRSAWYLYTVGCFAAYVDQFFFQFALYEFSGERLSERIFWKKIISLDTSENITHPLTQNADSFCELKNVSLWTLFVDSPRGLYTPLVSSNTPVSSV